MIGCRVAVERLWAYVDQELDDHDHEAVDAHLALCRRCCGELEFAKHLKRLLASDRTGELPRALRARLDHFIDDLRETGCGLTGPDPAADLIEITGP